MNTEFDVVPEVQDFVSDCVSRAGLELECSCELQDDTITVNLKGPDATLVLRDNARLLYAINHLVNQVFFRRATGQYNFAVDCEDYRNTRVMELRLLAQKAAEQVASTGKPFRLQAMPAGERRIIHLALADEEGVKTESEGGGLYRRVVICLAD